MRVLSTDAARPIPAARSRGGDQAAYRRATRAVAGPDQDANYITWAQYERNLHQLQTNTAGVVAASARAPFPVVRIAHLRTLWCMATQYNNNCRGLRITCSRMAVVTANLCQPHRRGPDEIAACSSRLQPAALEISLQVAADLEAERAREHAQWRQRLERAAYTTQRAERQYQAVEPENRLVARTLERQWEEALAAQAIVAADYERFRTSASNPLSEAERAAIRRLAADIPALWEAPSTTAAERQAILRQLIERVIVTVRDDTEQVSVEVHWAGGHRTATGIIRPVARFEQLSYYPDLLARVVALQGQGLSCIAIAERLNAEGWHPPKRRDTFNAPMVAHLLARQGLHTGSPKQRGEAGTLQYFGHVLIAWTVATAAAAVGEDHGADGCLGNCERTFERSGGGVDMRGVFKTCAAKRVGRGMMG
jgi:hypothetical protein